MIFILLSIFISSAFSGGSGDDCAYLGELAVDQCIVLPEGQMEATFGESEAVGLTVTCETDTKWTLNGFKNKKCTSKVDDDIYPLDISFLCLGTQPKEECHCGDDTHVDDCYIMISDYQDCDNDGKYNVEDDLTVQYSTIVGECVAVDEDNKEYDHNNTKWKLTECNDNNNVYDPWTTTFYEDATCETEFRERGLDCSSLSSESVTCDVTAHVNAGYYCGRFEGHPLGVCSASGEFSTSAETYYESSMYYCENANTFKKITYPTQHCSGDDFDTEDVDCSRDHNCVCDVVGGLTDGSTGECGYKLFSYTATGPCTDTYHDRTGTVQYTVTLDEDMCALDDEKLNGVKYHCGSGATTPSDLTFTIYPHDVTCSGDTYCSYERTVNCAYWTPIAPVSCNYYANYPIGVCSNMKTYTDGSQNTIETSIIYDCNDDTGNSIQTNTFSGLDCNATNLISSEACMECTTDDRGIESCDKCKGKCSATTSDCTLAQIHQNVQCKLVADDSAAEEIYYTELLVLDECQNIASKYRKDTCSGTVITQTVFEDDACTNAREQCSISEYEGDYGLDYEEHDSAVTECVSKTGTGNGECGYIDQYPIDTCVLSYTDKFGDMSFSGKFSCLEHSQYQVSIYEGGDCSGELIHTEAKNCGDGNVVCECGGTAEFCDLLTIRLTDTCLETETFLTVVMPDECQKIDDVEDWDLYLGIFCDETQDDGVTFAIFEDDECKKEANAFRYKSDVDGCTHYLEWFGVCGDFDEGRGFLSNHSNGNDVKLLFATAFTAILSLFL